MALLEADIGLVIGGDVNCLLLGMMVVSWSINELRVCCKNS